MDSSPDKRYRSKSLRLKSHDYSEKGYYYITICVKNRNHFFGKINNGQMILNEFGIVTNNQWLKLVDRFPNIELDVFQIMPNHMHGIIIINDRPVATGLAPVDFDTDGNQQNNSEFTNVTDPNFGQQNNRDFMR